MQHPLAIAPFSIPTHAETLMGWIPNERFMVQWSGNAFPWPMNMETFRRLEDATDRKSYTLVHTPTGAFSGYAELNRINLLSSSATISRLIISPESRGKGWGEQFIKMVLEQGFEKLNLHRIELHVADFNMTAINLYQKIGFVMEGYVRDYCKHEGGYWSVYKMSLLDKEWQAIKKSF